MQVIFDFFTVVLGQGSSSWFCSATRISSGFFACLPYSNPWVHTSQHGRQIHFQANAGRPGVEFATVLCGAICFSLADGLGMHAWEPQTRRKNKRGGLVERRPTTLWCAPAPSVPPGLGLRIFLPYCTAVWQYKEYPLWETKKK